MRRAARKDDTHRDIVNHAKSLGFSVWETYQLPNSCDCVFIRNGNVFFVEIKDGKKSPSRRRLTVGEELFKKMIDESGGNYVVVDDIGSVNKLFLSTL